MQIDGTVTGSRGKFYGSIFKQCNDAKTNIELHELPSESVIDIVLLN